MKLNFYGADQCVTGSCHCLDIGGKRILVDCGLQQGRDEVSNAEFPFAANTIDYLLVTHAHIDHSGRIPMLIKQTDTDLPVLDTTALHAMAAVRLAEELDK